MKINQPAGRIARQIGFTIVEVMVAMAVMGIVVVSLYSGFTAGFVVVEVARENLRATQIMVEKMETIRLYTWDQINSNGFIPTSFTNYYDYTSTNSGISFNGTVAITTPSSMTESYKTNLKLITVTVNWTSGNVPRSREMTSLVSRYGLQTYIY